MNNDMRRVGLVFTQEGAVDFKRSLQDINLEMNKNYNQFKLTQAQWDKSTDSTKKLREEQEYLKNAYELQADKVSTLKMQLADLENSENKNTTAIKKKRNELTNAEIKLKDYEKRIKEVDQQLTNHGKKIEEVGEKVHKFGEKIEKAGKKLSAFSAATAAALVASAKTAIDFESAFAGVEKTVDGTEEQMAALKQGIRDMAKEIPSTTTEISAVAEAAGQLGIKTEDILSFTRVMIDLGNSTNLSAEEAASSLAKFANVTKMSAKDYDRLGATIVALGNNFATTEADIVSMATNLAASGELAGLSESQILALATAMSSVGIEAQAGGSAMSKLLKKIQVATETGSKDLDKFANIAGMTSKEFKQAFERDAVKALTAFIAGLNDTERNGKSAISILDDMGLTEVRLSNTILSLANASDLMTKAVNMGSKAWEDNTALTNEANKRYDTLKSKITVALNQLKDIAITIGNKMMPSIEKLLDKGTQVSKWIESLNEDQIDAILKIGLVVAAIGPLLKILGSVTSVTGTAIKGIGTFTQAIGVMNGSVTTSSKTVSGLAGVLTQLTSPAGIATTAVLALVAAYTAMIYKTHESSRVSEQVLENTKKQIEAQNEMIKSYDASKDAVFAEMKNVNNLANELDMLVDENGKVKESYEGRVSFILNQLNNAMGTEYQMIDGTIVKYDELRKSVEEVTRAKKIEALMESEQGKYTEALKNKAEAYNKLVDAEKEVAKKEQELKEYEDNRTKFFAGTTVSSVFVPTIITSSLNAYYDSKWDNAKKDLENTKENLRLQQKAYDENLKYIREYESDLIIAESGTTEEIDNLIARRTTSYSKATDDIGGEIKQQIENQLYDLKITQQCLNEAVKSHDEAAQKECTIQKESQEKQLRILAKNLADMTSTTEKMTPAQIQAWRELAYNSEQIYSDILATMPEELRVRIQGMTDVIYKETPNVSNATEFLSDEILERLQNDSEFRAVAINNLQGFLNGLDNPTLKYLLKQAGITDINQVMQGIRSGNLAESEGLAILEGLRRGLNNSNSQSKLFDVAGFLKKKLVSILGNINISYGVIPGHKLGLDYVPKDDYVARLHKGERVLTKEENEAYTRAESQSNTNGNTNVFGAANIDYSKMANAFVKALGSAKFVVDEDGFGRFVENKIYEVI